MGPGHVVCGLLQGHAVPDITLEEVAFVGVPLGVVMVYRV